VSVNLWEPLQENSRPHGMHAKTFFRLAGREKRYRAASFSWVESLLSAFEAKKLG